MSFFCVSDEGPLSADQIFKVTRLVQLFEYMMRNLYEPPKQLLDQVQHNIFKRQPNSAVKYFSAGGRAFGCQKTSSKFYSLYPIVETFSNDSRHSPEVPKLDGLACSFILGTPDSLDYNLLYQSLVDLIQVCPLTHLLFAFLIKKIVICPPGKLMTP